MKDPLEKFVGANRDAFDNLEPSPLTWKNIEESLGTTKKISLWNSVSIWRAAAVILLASCVYLFASREPAVQQKKEVAQLPKDFSDQESFYTSLIAEKMGMISDYDSLGEHQLFTQDYKKLDAMYQVLGEELKSNPDKKVKDAMILNLLVRIDLLNQQLKKLEDDKSKKKSAATDV